MRFTEIDSPVGGLLIAGDDAGLRSISFERGRKKPEVLPEWRRDSEGFVEVVAQLEAYFAGELRVFRLQLAPRGTDFQLRVWHQLSLIPYGETVSYGELARRLGRPGASRAVGAANGSNPLSIVLPCHRVIGSDGKLTGYGGGLENKERLLALERAQLPGAQPELVFT